ncbi:hypothetical protein K2B98_001516 [Vibrio parahaemolyticus]|nr:hypothetical protein [Vibrio parahaemolyticus]EHY0961133.1 hypothetical protein [Vibrio parahaemolyticus]EHY0999516.1 hypothetical protein [Vibrio parahaemolyticus]EII3037151.1 hypothetical protein [Vibrio parahaemolyticus]EII5836048.1 hypothetical protein [Vibrio parahaemolyticus]
MSGSVTHNLTVHYASGRFHEINSEHSDFYGSYGIGLKRDWGNACGLSPVIYASSKSQIVKLSRH